MEREVVMQLPGQHDFDQHYDTGAQIRMLPNYELNDETGEINIYDPVWGKETIGDWEGDQIFAELFRHPVFQRLDAIEQLTLPRPYTTMPGASEFSRWEHAWGSVVFVRKMIRQAEAEGRQFDDREKLVLQLRTFLSDAGHTAFSHLGDWLRQSFGGSEDSHDQELGEFLELTGVNDILQRHDIDPEEVIFPPSQDWVECDSPDLCVDRVDYGVREILRWVDPSSESLWQSAFRIDEQNRLVMKNEKLAKYFGLCFGMLATEHWVQPVHRLQLQFFGELVKGAVLNEPGLIRGSDLHVVDKLYTIDSDLFANIRAMGPLNNDLHALVLDIARAQRRIFALGKSEDLRFFVHAALYGSPSQNDDFPHPLTKHTWRTEYSGVKPQNIELIPVADKEEATEIEPQPLP